MNRGGTIDRLLQLLDDCSIDQAVCFAPFHYQCEELGVDPIAWLAGELKKHRNRLFGFGTIDTRRADVKDQVKRVVDHGLLGLKLHPNAQNFDLLSPRMFEVYAAAQDAHLFLTFHSGVHRSRLADIQPIRFDEIGWNFPKLRFSMEHVGGYHFFDQALAVIFNHAPPPWETGVCNVFAGLTSIFTNDHNRFWYLTDERIKEIASQVGVRQMIFGLDFPYNLEPQTKIAFQRLRELFTESEQEQILGGNLRRELGLA